ncbi:MAG: hypothetical protein Q9157_000791 [Trypethelium eluteriae]
MEDGEGAAVLAANPIESEQVLHTTEHGPEDLGEGDSKTDGPTHSAESDNVVMDFHGFLKAIYGQSATSLWEIETYNFEIRAPDGSLIHSSAWNELVEPGWEITFQFCSETQPFEAEKLKGVTDNEKDDSVKNADKELKETIYEDKVSYMLRFVISDLFGPFQYHFDYEQEFETKPLLQKKDTRPKRLPVIQEIIKIVHPENAPRRRLRRRNSDDSTSETLNGKAKDESDEDGKVDPTALGPQDRVLTRHLIINSPLLLNALRAVVCYTSHEADETNDVDESNSDIFEKGEFQYPYRDLYLHKDDLRRYQKQHPSRERHSEEYNNACDRHINALVDYLYLQDEIRLKQAEERWEKTVPTTTFGSLWLLMKPGTDVYVKEYGLHNAYVIELTREQFSKKHQTRCYAIEVWNLVFNGRAISRQTKTILIPVFDGEREITSLPLYPERFHPKRSEDQQSLRQELVERGKKYVSLARGPSYMAYSGQGLQSGTKDYDRARAVVDYKRNKIATSHSSKGILEFDPYEINDPFAFPFPGRDRIPGDDPKIGSRARMPECKCENCQRHNSERQIYAPLTFGSYDDLNPRDDHAFDDHKYFLCDSRLHAFMLKDRIWDLLDVNRIEEAEIDAHAIDKLVMKTESNKDLIKAICAAYTSQEHGGKPYFTDYIQGKGEGQVFLLHGPPGTGKTLTAESVAEFTKRPLLSITTADLGDDPIQLERNLLTFFRDANDWGAIVLLDEADVYMERRSIDDLMRNSVVSIFLRALDYFKGILFLTTNRVGLFDDAFMSRIHVQIGYDKLEEPARQVIWTNNFDMLADNASTRGKAIKVAQSAKEYVEESEMLRKLEWNGREIRNGNVDLHLIRASFHTTGA